MPLCTERTTPFPTKHVPYRLSSTGYLLHVISAFVRSDTPTHLARETLSQGSQTRGSTSYALPI